MIEKSHKRLLVWQKAIDLVTLVYRLTASFPEEERFGLVSQMRRAAVSVASNIAEGAARKSRKEKTQFFINARGSLSELDTQLVIVDRLSFGVAEARQEMVVILDEVGRLLSGLIASQNRL